MKTPSKEAIDRVSALKEFKPLWIEEPTKDDDILGTFTKFRVENQIFESKSKFESKIRPCRKVLIFETKNHFWIKSLNF